MNAPRARVVMVLAWGLVSATSADARDAKTRPADCAGGWYPASAEALKQTLTEAFADASPPSLTGKPRALIAPHAGYRWSAPVAATAYSSLRGQQYDRVVVLAFSHRMSSRYHGIDVPETLEAYETPLGPVPVDRAACDTLLSHSLFSHHAGVDRGEHSLELQLPYLQHVLGEFRLVPLLVGRMSGSDFAAAAEALVPMLDDKTLVVASSDFTHYGSRFNYVPFTDDVPDKLREQADHAAAPILDADFDGFEAYLQATRDTICGRNPIKLLLRVLSMQGGAAGLRSGFDTSGQMTGDWRNSVTYQAFVFTDRPGTLPADARACLLRLARETVTAQLTGKPLPDAKPDAWPADVRGNGGCFVTLENGGELRGCIGNMDARDALYTAVMRNAVYACQDSRFRQNPVTAAELPQLHVEISYLTPMKRVANPDDIVVGRHGLLIDKGNRRGVLLPQVAYSRGWTRDEFLAQVCRKAGLPMDAWRQPDATLYSFTAEVFGEPMAAATHEHPGTASPNTR